MADKTIYPFGTGGQLPSGIGLINDLVTGGTNKALTAEMGKEIKRLLDGIGVSFKVDGKALVIRNAAYPYLKVMPSSVSFDDTLFDDTTTASVHIYGRNLDDAVTVQVSGVGFSGSATLLPNIAGIVDEDVTITFAPTEASGTEGDVGNEYNGMVTASSSGADSSSAVLEGVGVENIVPRITATIDKAVLKGVKSDTASGSYSSVPATATLHVQARNIDDILTLSVDSAKFLLSANQISLEDSLVGKDITVSYVRQADVTSSDDEGTITIVGTLGAESRTKEIDITGSTAAKKSGDGTNIVTINDVIYFFDGTTVSAKKTSATAPSGALSLPAEIFDNYGYKYIPTAIGSNGFKDNTSLTSFIAGSQITKIYSSAFSGCTNLESVKVGTITTTRASMFSNCTKLRIFEAVSMSIGYSSIFYNCIKLETIILSGDSMSTFYADGENSFPSDTLLIDGEEKTVYYYTDSNGDKHQKKLYVPSSLVNNYSGNTYWSRFEIHSIDELN